MVLQSPAERGTFVIVVVVMVVVVVVVVMMTLLTMSLTHRIVTGIKFSNHGMN